MPICARRVRLFRVAFIFTLLSFAPASTLAQQPTLHPTAHSELEPLSGIQAIAAGNHHTCALTNEGGVKCWGDNRNGQVGNGDDSGTYIRTLPEDVVGLQSGVKAIATGSEHTCALTESGGVKCWGSDSAGQIGDGPADEEPVWNDYKFAPVDVTGLGSGVLAIAAGSGHTCALLETGGVMCWGYDENGQVGEGANTDYKPVPVDVIGLPSNVVAISAGYDRSCAITSTGALMCWGRDLFGVLGDPSNSDDMHEPTEMEGLSTGVQRFAAGHQHDCALVTGGVQCWGRNNFYQLGDGTQTPKFTPTDVPGLTTGMKSVAAGMDFSCALTSASGVKCWGPDHYGQNGDGPPGFGGYPKLGEYDSPPTNVTDLDTGVESIALGNIHGCALMEDSGVKCWGYDFYGQVGDGPNPTNENVRPVPVDVLIEVVAEQVDYKTYLPNIR